MSTPHDQQIRERAYFLWEAAGKPDGADLTHWLEAERDLGANGTEPNVAPDAAPPPMPKAKTTARKPRKRAAKTATPAQTSKTAKTAKNTAMTAAGGTKAASPRKRTTTAKSPAAKGTTAP